MTILQLFFNKSSNPPSGIYATGGNFVEVAAGPPGVLTKRHVFTGPGTFTITAIPPGISVNYLVVAGGGGGGTDNVSPPTTGAAGAGGGGGGWRHGTFPVSVASYPVVIGAGGAGGTPTLPSYGANGGDTSFSTIVSTGGGGGAGLNGTSPGLYQGSTGGSGGGSRRWPSNGTPSPLNGVAGGLNVPTQGFTGGSVPAVIPPSGPGAGPAPRYNSGFNGAGGGGARNAPPQPFTPTPGLGIPVDGTVSSRGGQGGLIPREISPNQHGTPGPAPLVQYFSGGGSGGMAQPAPSFPAPFGTPISPTTPGVSSQAGGGGGHGLNGTSNPGIVNTGGGGGGYGGATPGGTGGSGAPGIVIISYPW